uniref:CASP-like protein n=1 Tax=Aegilops tauschii TaxID=37682 RepID=N1QWK9_AEGTA
MAVSRRTGWIAACLLARLLMVTVLLMSVRFVLANYIHWDHTQGVYKLQSYTKSGSIGQLHNQFADIGLS